MPHMDKLLSKMEVSQTSGLNEYIYNDVELQLYSIDSNIFNSAVKCIFARLAATGADFLGALGANVKFNVTIYIYNAIMRKIEN